jgi:ubiquitin carboxyl-terminal hydrolase 4/11/15
MGGAEDAPHRSSSPLKRRASNLEEEEKEDIDMITVPDAPEATDTATRPQSVDMINEQSQGQGKANAETGRFTGLLNTSRLQVANILRLQISHPSMFRSRLSQHSARLLTSTSLRKEIRSI